MDQKLQGCVIYGGGCHSRVKIFCNLSFIISFVDLIVEYRYKGVFPIE